MPPALVRGTPVGKKLVAFVKLDVTAYLVGPDEADLDALVSLYERICSPSVMQKYLIAEIQDWDSVSRPRWLTDRGVDAAARGMKYPFIEPVRERIRRGRAFTLKFWDGKNIDGFSAPESWSFGVERIHLRGSGLHAVVRATFPLDVDLGIPKQFAVEVANTAAFYSGHGGLTFAYDPWHKYDAFTDIYRKARRFWGLDIHDLNLTLPLVREAIKGVNWLTMLGAGFVREAALEAPLALLGKRGDIDVTTCRHGLVIQAGPRPEPGDQNRPDARLDPYFAVADALRPLFLAGHPDFTGEGFIRNSNTVGWLRRFIEPGGWR